MIKKEFRKLKGTSGPYTNLNTGSYYVEKRVFRKDYEAYSRAEIQR